uniref:Uncharacterized protein n=1 Tax=Haptolina ericina TaxID=156174 RepID=A0A7S3EU16_9EUKA
MFPDKNDLPGNSDPNEKRVSMALATHALAFQITSLGRGGRRLQRVVGVHAVRDCTADLLNDLVWETIGHLVQPWRKLFFISDPAHALKKPYMAKSAREIERDARVIELRFLLKIQLHFDLQLEIEGFLGLLHDQVERHGSVALLPRKLSQDTLESLFGCRRE